MRSDARRAAPAAILVVEHDVLLGAPLVEQLVADGYEAHLARSLEHARTLARAAPPRLLVLGELESPRRALELLVEVRADRRLEAGCSQAARAASGWSADLPVIVLGAQARESDLLRAFEAGADDFIARPASYLELRARLRALLARTTDTRDSRLVRVGALAIDTATRTVSLHGRGVALRRLEYELLLTLAREPERVFTKHELMGLVWGYRAPGSTRTLDSHASRLRHALGAEGYGRWVLNVRGVGYRLT
jgi:DNA-binding response OmpR family regulator